MSRHHEVAERAAADLVRAPGVEAVLLAGSVARNEHRLSSDIDLLVVTAATDLPVRILVNGLLVERIAHSEAGWLQRFDRPRTSWLYAFREAVVLYDTGPAARLRTRADEVYSGYQAGATLRSTLATALWHGQAKLARALDGGDRLQGFWSSIVVENLIDALYTVHDRPLPAGSRRLEHLAIVPLTTAEAADLDQLLTGRPDERIAAAVRLLEHLRTLLGPADHEASG